MTLLVTLGITAYLTRVFSPEYYGILGFGTALLSYFVLIVRFGFDTLATRESARRPEDIPKLVTRISSLKLFLSVPTYLAFLLVVLLLPKDALFRQVLAVQGLLLFGLAISVEWVYLGIQRMSVLATRNVAVALLHAAAVALLVRDPSDILLAAFASVAAVAIGNGWILVSYRRDFQPLRLQFESREWLRLAKPALPIAASSLMIAVYYSLDQVMIGLMRGERDVGLYTAGYQLLAAALIPAQICYQAFFPVLSKSLGKREDMQASASLYSQSMASIGLPLAVGGALLGGPILTAFAGQPYEPGATAFRLLMVNAGLVYLNMALGQPLIAWNRQKSYFWAVGSGAMANVILNALLIPSYGITGAATATILSECAVLAGLGYLHWRTVGTVFPGIWLRAGTAAALGVGGTIVGLHALGFGPLWSGACCVVTYSLVAWAFGLAKPSELLRALGRGPIR